MFAEGDAASLSRIATWGPCSEELGLLDAATAGGTEAPAGLPAEAVVAFSVDAGLPVIPLGLAPGTAGADVAGLAGLVAAVAGLPVVPGAATLAPGAVAAVAPVLAPGAVVAVPVRAPGAVTAAPAAVVAEAAPA